MTATLVKNLASKFSLSQEELVKEGIKAFLFNQLHLLEIERRKIFKHYGVQAIDEFDQLLINNPNQESDLLENFQRTNYLTHQIEEISQWINEF
jgi:hypothetical protein